jgi:hypothetical protein
VRVSQILDLRSKLVDKAVDVFHGEHAALQGRLTKPEPRFRLLPEKPGDFRDVRVPIPVLLGPLLMPAQLMFGNSDMNARGAGLPLVALRSLAMQASIKQTHSGLIKCTSHMAFGSGDSFDSPRHGK